MCEWGSSGLFLHPVLETQVLIWRPITKGYVTCPTKHTADKGRTTTLNHAIKREIKIQSTSGIQPRMLLICFSIEAVFLPVGCLRALAVPTGLFTPLSILTLIWSSLILHECFSTSSFTYATSVVGLCYFCSCVCQTQSLSRAGQELYNQVLPRV